MDKRQLCQGRLGEDTRAQEPVPFASPPKQQFSEGAAIVYSLKGKKGEREGRRHGKGNQSTNNVEGIKAPTTATICILQRSCSKI